MDDFGYGVHGRASSTARSDDVGGGVVACVKGRGRAVDFFYVDDFAVLRQKKKRDATLRQRC